MAWIFLFSFTALTFAAYDGDSANSEWFKSLKIPGTQSSCCDVTDCHMVDYDTDGDHYRAFIKGRWREIPSDRILHNKGNPTGRAVACYSVGVDDSVTILCFVAAGGV